MAFGLLDLLRGNQQQAPFVMPMQEANQSPFPTPDGGFMGFLKSPRGKGLLYGAGLGLLAKMQDANNPIVPTAIQGAQQYEQEAKKQQINALLSNPGLLNNPEALKQLAPMMITSDDPKLKEFGLKLMMGTGEPFTVKPGEIRYDAFGRPIVDRSKDKEEKPTPLHTNLVEAGYEPGTPEYKKAMNEALFKTGNAGGASMMNFRKQLETDNKLYKYGWSEDKLEEAQSRYLKGYKTFADGKPLPELSGTASQYANQVYMHGMNSQSQTQMRAAQMVDRILEKADTQAKNAVRYSSIAGQGQLLADRVKSGFGKGTKEYQDYIKFTRVTVPAAVNAAVKAEGANMSDDSKKLLIDSLSPLAWDKDFDTAYEQFKWFKELYGGTISPIAASDLPDVKAGIRDNQEQYGQEGNQQTVSITNTKTGETKTVSLAEAKRLGVPNV